MNAIHFERVGKILCQKDKVSHPKETFLLDVLLIHGSESAPVCCNGGVSQLI